MLHFLKAHLLWFAVPMVLVLGLAAGIASAASEPAPPPALRKEGEATVARMPSYSVSGRVVKIDLEARALIVQNKAGRRVPVFLNANTVIKIGQTRARPREIRVGDNVVVVGQPHDRQGLDARAITVARRPEAKPTPQRFDTTPTP